jgi:hypothetical protein
MSSSIQDFPARSKASPKILGGAPSAWLATTEFNIGKDCIADFAACAELLWSGRDRASEQAQTLDAIMPRIRRRLSAQPEPSATDPVVPLNLNAYFNATVPGLEAASWKSGRVSRGRLVFDLADAAKNGNCVVAAGSRGSGKSSYPSQAEAIEIGQDVSSLLFLHALAKPADSTQGYQRIYAFEDSADLVGWYEVEYEDGLIATVPLRYKWNILEWQNQRGTAYAADALNCGNGATFYAFEWTNPRMGKVIKKVRLSGSHVFKNNAGKTVPSNTVILAAISVVPKRDASEHPDPPLPR